MNSDKIFYTIVGAFTFLIFAGILFFANKNGPTVEQVNNDSEVLKTTDTLESIGNDPHTSLPIDEAKVVVVEFSDFQCPACKNAWSGVVSRIKADFGDQVAVVYRHFPLTSIHDYAFEASLASEAAANQDAFWEYHDELFRRQTSAGEPSLTEEDFIGIATELGLNVEQFTSDFNSSETEQKVREDMTYGTSIGVNSTPTFVVNGAVLNLRYADPYEYVSNILSDMGEEDTSAVEEQE
jgi:protein-disulfide isomerase